MNKFIESTLDGILNYVKDGIVFLDDAAAECFHWSNGLSKLLDAGALDVRDIKHTKECLESESKCVFLITTTLQGNVLKYIQRIIKSSDFVECTIISSVSGDINQFICRNQKTPPFDDVAQQIKTWMKNDFAIVSIQYHPFFLIQLLPDFFVTPVHNNVFPMLPSDVARLQAFLHSQGDKRMFDNLGDIDMAFLPHNMQSKIKMVASSLNTMFKSLNIHEDCYATGHFSRLIACELANMPDAKVRRKVATSRASIVFVDRTLDLVAPVSHASSSVLGMIYEILPRLKNHNNDVSVNMESLLSHGNVSGTTVFPGCLSHNNDAISQKVLNMFVTKSKKECINFLCDKLKELLKEHGFEQGNENDDDDKPSLDVLKSILEKFKDNSLLMKYTAFLQCVLSLVNTYTDEENEHIEEVLSSEKVILAELGEERCDPLSLILQLIADKDNTLFTLLDVILLCLFVFSAGVEEFNEFWYEKEEKLKECLIQILIDGKNKEDMLFLIGDLDASERQIRTCISEIFERLHGIASARKNLKQLNVLLAKDEFGFVKYKPLVNQVLELVFDESKKELIDIEFCSHGLKDFLKTGFGFFMNVSKPRPDDHPFLIIFMVGGITWFEVKEIRDTLVRLNVKSHKVIIASTRILTPFDTLEQLICSENLFVDVDS